MTLLFIIIASLLSGLIALLFALILFDGRLWTHARSHFFLSFGAGTLLGVAFLDLMPEAIEGLEEILGGDVIEIGLLTILAGFLVFFILEKLVLWRHCHEEYCDVHASTSMILVGDTLHNLLDGVAIAVGFLVNPAVGVATTVAVFFHEIPQEIADFGILLQNGLKKRRAIMFNLLSSLASLAGAIVTYFLATQIESLVLIPTLTAITAGGFLYIASADLIPEIHKETRRSSILWQILLFFLGIGVMILIGTLFSHGH